MDDINAFFNLSKDFKRENLPATHINTRLLPGPSNFVQPKFVGTEYGDEYRKAELEKVGPGFIITKFVKMDHVFCESIFYERR